MDKIIKLQEFLAKRLCFIAAEEQRVASAVIDVLVETISSGVVSEQTGQAWQKLLHKQSHHVQWMMIPAFLLTIKELRPWLRENLNIEISYSNALALGEMINREIGRDFGTLNSILGDIGRSGLGRLPHCYLSNPTPQEYIAITNELDKQQPRFHRDSLTYRSPFDPPKEIEFHTTDYTLEEGRRLHSSAPIYARVFHIPLDCDNVDEVVDSVIKQTFRSVQQREYEDE